MSCGNPDAAMIQDPQSSDVLGVDPENFIKICLLYFLLVLLTELSGNACFNTSNLNVSVARPIRGSFNKVKTDYTN